MNTVRADNKIGEARFFLERLREANREPQAFRYYLSAFLSAVISVKYVLTHEHERKFNAWFSDWKNAQSLEDRQLLNYMWGQRNAEVHKSGADVATARRYVLFPGVDMMYAHAALLEESKERLVPMPADFVYVREHFFEKGAERTSAMEDCARLLTLMERLVSEVSNV